MTEKILFIGAGASFGARIDQEKTPPLGPTLCRWLRAVSPDFESELGLIEFHSEIREAMNILARYPGEDNYEQLISKLDRKDRERLNRLLLITFSDISGKRTKLDLSKFDYGFRFQYDGYDRLIEKLGLGDGTWSIVSLNYDLLIEEALRRNSIEFIYPHFPFLYGQDQSALPGIRIYKPHGSINFFAHGDHRIFHREPLSSDDRGQPTGYYTDAKGNSSHTHPIVMATPPGVENILHIADSASISEPVMANYTKGKPAYTNQETLEQVRRDALAAFRAAGEVLIIGVKPIIDDADDQFVCDVLSASLKNLTYVSGSEDECRIIKGRHPDARTQFHGLQDFLAIAVQGPL